MSDRVYFKTTITLEIFVESHVNQEYGDEEFSYEIRTPNGEAIRAVTDLPSQSSALSLMLEDLKALNNGEPLDRVSLVQVERNS